MRKHPALVCSSRFGVPRNALAVLLVLHYALWVASGLAVEAEDASKVDSLNRHVVDLHRAGKYQEAILIARQVLEIRERINGPEHPDTATGFNNLAVLYKAMGDYAKAEPLYQRALAIYERALDPEHPLTAAGLNNLGLLYQLMGDYAKAEPLSRRALAITEKARGPEHPDTAANLGNLAGLYGAIGDYPKAEALYRRAVAINEKAGGPEHPETARSLNDLAVLYQAMGDYPKAEAFYRRGLAIREKALDPNHPDTAISLNNLAGLYRAMGDYAKAEALIRRAVAINEKARGPDHPETAISLNNLAVLFRAMGDYAKAEPLLLRALAIQEKAPRPGSSRHRPQPQQPGGALHGDGQLRQSRTALSARIGDQSKSARPGAPRHRNQPQQPGGALRSIRDYVRIEPFLRRSLAISEKALRTSSIPTPPSASTTWRGFTGRWATTPKPNRSTGARGDFRKSARFGALSTATTLRNLAILNIDLGKAGGALEFAVRAKKPQETQLGNILAFTSEQQRLALQEKTTPFTLLATLGTDPDIAQAILRNKGVVLDSVLEDRLVAEASKDAKQREVIDQLRAAEQRAAQVLMEGPREFSTEASRRRGLNGEASDTS